MASEEENGTQQFDATIRGDRPLEELLILVDSTASKEVAALLYTIKAQNERIIAIVEQAETMLKAIQDSPLGAMMTGGQFDMSALMGAGGF